MRTEDFIHHTRRAPDLRLMRLERQQRRQEDPGFLSRRLSAARIGGLILVGVVVLYVVFCALAVLL